MSRLSAFIRENTEEILNEWETFARSVPTGSAMNVEDLRDHAKGMLEVIATDLETSQSAGQQDDKAHGKADAADTIEYYVPTPAQQHGAGRAESGFNVGQMVSEFRALRASVIRLWTKDFKEANYSDLLDITRFSEAIDQAVSESIARFTRDIADSRERFIAILSHDLRTPLGSIITSTGFMLDTGELREPILTLVTRIGTSARRMNQMVLDLLDFTRLRLGDTIPIVTGDTDVRRVVNDVIEEVATMYPRSKVHVETTGDLRGKWDQARLSQALTNLITNATQHGAATAPVHVAAHGSDREVVISVHNDGPVIPKEKMAHLFDAMKQNRGDDGGDRRHLGLGLYIVDKIVKAHGGSVDVQSSEEQGTTFTVRLPR